MLAQISNRDLQTKYLDYLLIYQMQIFFLSLFNNNHLHNVYEDDLFSIRDS
jgi:hypothetical protein